MTTHSRARVVQAGAFLALIGGALVAMPSPASAAVGDPTVVITPLKPANLQAGQRTTLVYKVTNNKEAASGETAFRIVVSSTLNELTCDGNRCRFEDKIPGGQSKEYTVTLVGGALPSGEVKAGQIQIQAAVGKTVGTASSVGTASRDVTVRNDRSPTVREVSGRVRDQDGKAVSGAQVGLTDSQGHQYTTDTNSSGNFRFTSSDARPIVPGPITVGARKDGFQIVTQNVTGQAGRTLVVALTMRSTAAPSKSATPSASAKASLKATDEPTADPTGTALNADPAAGDGDSGSMLFIVLGGLLVAAGVGAIVLVLMRRRNEARSDPDAAGGVGGGGDGGGGGGGGGGGVVPPSQGRWGSASDATRVVNRTGADATMLAGAGALPPMSDAPTMLHQPVPIDEFADPYGAPSAVPHAGYGTGAYGATAPGTYGAAGAPGTYGGAAQPAGGDYGNPAEPYGAAPATQYGRPPARGGAYDPPADAYGQPSGAAGYGVAPQSGGGYGAADQRYDEPTGRYDPATGGTAGGYRGSPAGYSATGPEYPQPGRQQQPSSGAPYQGGAGYQGGAYQAAAPAGGYPAAEQSSWGTGGGVDSGSYGAPTGTYSGGYGGGTPAGGGYDAPGGYDPRGSYSSTGGYDRMPEQPQGRAAGHPTQGGYDEPGYLGGEPPAQGGRRGARPPAPDQGQRRPLDWLDD